MDIEGIIESAKKKGYFDPADYPGARLSMDELVEIQRGLMEDNIPISVRKTIEGIKQSRSIGDYQFLEERGTPKHRCLLLLGW